MTGATGGTADGIRAMGDAGGISRGLSAGSWVVLTLGGHAFKQSSRLSWWRPPSAERVRIVLCAAVGGVRATGAWGV